MSRFFAIAGLLAALVLTVIDFVTSYRGIRAIIPADTQSFVLGVTPYVIAIMALAFNSCTAKLFRLYRDHGLGGMILFGLWTLFITYDLGTSFAGIVLEMAQRPLEDIGAAVEAFAGLDPAGKTFAAVLAVLVGSSPYLASAFSELAREAFEFDGRPVPHA